jgi:hypothetical protein
MLYDLNKADRQREMKPVPPGVYRLATKLRPGGIGTEGLLRLAKNLRTEMLDLELTVVGGEYDGRKLWDLITLEADDSNHPDLPSLDREQARKYKTAVDMGRAKLRAILESANEISPDDDGEQAQRIRRPASLRVLDGLEFIAKISIKQGEGKYSDRNTVVYIVTNDMDEWPQTPKPPIREQLDDDIPF